MNSVDSALAPLQAWERQVLGVGASLIKQLNISSDPLKVRESTVTDAATLRKAKIYILSYGVARYNLMLNSIGFTDVAETWARVHEHLQMWIDRQSVIDERVRLITGRRPAGAEADVSAEVMKSFVRAFSGSHRPNEPTPSPSR